MGRGSRCPLRGLAWTRRTRGGRNGVQAERGPGGDSRAGFYNPGGPRPFRAGRASSQGHLEWPRVRGVPGRGLVQESYCAGTPNPASESCSQGWQVPGPRCISEGPAWAPSAHRAGDVAGATRSSPSGRPHVSGRAALPAAGSFLLEGAGTDVSPAECRRPGVAKPRTPIRCSTLSCCLPH